MKGRPRSVILCRVEIGGTPRARQVRTRLGQNAHRFGSARKAACQNPLYWLGSTFTLTSERPFRSKLPTFRASHGNRVVRRAYHPSSVMIEANDQIAVVKFAFIG
jgi:hypothetical protein